MAKAWAHEKDDIRKMYELVAEKINENAKQGQGQRDLLKRANVELMKRKVEKFP